MTSPKSLLLITVLLSLLFMTYQTEVVVTCQKCTITTTNTTTNSTTNTTTNSTTNTTKNTTTTTTTFCQRITSSNNFNKTYNINTTCSVGAKTVYEVAPCSSTSSCSTGICVINGNICLPEINRLLCISQTFNSDLYKCGTCSSANANCGSSCFTTTLFPGKELCTSLCNYVGSTFATSQCAGGVDSYGASCQCCLSIHNKASQVGKCSSEFGALGQSQFSTWAKTNTADSNFGGHLLFVLQLSFLIIVLAFVA